MLEGEFGGVALTVREEGETEFHPVSGEVRGELGVWRCVSCGCRREFAEQSCKVRGENNVADGLTKHVDRSKLEK